ncbi:DUF3618 domain-containing protein [Actinomadura sp. 7K507]|uniref:DUF3618 domain-containing protein n=1 Tax=Actinomadura sp. 7K507 TaxID=2530365 RepID=UPI00104E96A4|nr:DUF3618 domain-containing protein [Actinomadura sp. 7K507]TDC77684.1 DUF3618 domain-containing protein [Actinomadura sp. 7K507]
MTTQDKPTQGAGAGTDELRQEVDRARHDLGETVEQLAAKADVKALARQKAADAKSRMRQTVGSARDATARAKDSGAGEQAVRGGAVVASAGAVALAAVWMRKRRSAKSRLRGGQMLQRARSRAPGRTRGRTRGRGSPVRVVFRAGQKRPVRVRRRRGLR